MFLLLAVVVGDVDRGNDPLAVPCHLDKVLDQVRVIKVNANAHEVRTERTREVRDLLCVGVALVRRLVRDRLDRQRQAQRLGPLGQFGHAPPEPLADSRIVRPVQVVNHVGARRKDRGRLHSRHLLLNGFPPGRVGIRHAVAAQAAVHSPNLHPARGHGRGAFRIGVVASRYLDQPEPRFGQHVQSVREIARPQPLGLTHAHAGGYALHNLSPTAAHPNSRPRANPDRRLDGVDNWRHNAIILHT